MRGSVFVYVSACVHAHTSVQRVVGVGRRQGDIAASCLWVAWAVIGAETPQTAAGSEGTCGTHCSQNTQSQCTKKH